MNNATIEAEAEHGCRFIDLCEELYKEPEMIEYRKRCNSENCEWCDHYWGFLQGYCDAIEIGL